MIPKERIRSWGTDWSRNQERSIGNLNFDSSSQIGLEVREEIAFPEGGLQGWLVVFGSWCALFASLGIMNTMGSFQTYISTHQLKDYDSSSVGWIFSLYAFLAFGVGLFVGPVFDKHGPRWLVFAGSVLIILSMNLVGTCQDFWHFVLSFSILGGVGTALLFCPSIAIISHYFNTHRGNATGLATTGGAIGGIVFPLILQSLTPKIGFLWSSTIISVLSSLLCISAIIFIKPRFPPFKSTSAKPDIRILRNPAFAVTVLGVFLLEFALFVPLTYVSSYALSREFSPSFSYQILPILNAGSVFGRWIPGYYADAIGRFNAALISICLTVIAILGIWLPVGDTKPGIIFFALLFGFSSGSNIGLTPVCIGQLCNVRDYGRYYATCFSIVSLGCLTGVPIAGEILRRGNGSYDGLIWFVGICYLGGLLAFLSARIMATGWSFKVKY